MHIIPVIDLMQGQVVHAKLGDRQNYHPIESPICNSAKPIEVIDALLAIHPFQKIYCADLDALLGGKNQNQILHRLLCLHPNLEFWIDAGMTCEKLALNHKIVIGSESLRKADHEVLKNLRGDFILSLDFLKETLIGDQSILDNHDIWPEKIILMSLSHVGSQKGPDFERLKKFCTLWSGHSFFAAGGIRHSNDLKRLKDMGIHGALLASALHSKSLGSKDLKTI